MPRETRTSARFRASRSCNDVANSTKRRTRSGQQVVLQRPSTPNTGVFRKRGISRPQTFAFLARQQHFIDLDPNRQTCIFALPQELIQHISGYLPLISTICLTLTCKVAAEAIGTKYWVDYRKENRWSLDRYGLIELLSRDWGDILEFCVRCDTLHPPLQPPRSHRVTKLTKWCLGQDAIIDYLPNDASHGYIPVFQHIANAIEESKNFSRKQDVGPPVDSLSGSFAVAKGNIAWGMTSSAQRIDGCLVLKHVHSFRSRTNQQLSPTDLLGLPIRLCPHQSTTTAMPERSHHLKGQRNGRLLTQAITSAFTSLRKQSIDTDQFKTLTPSEVAQVSAAQHEDSTHWRCRSCTTKYHVQHSEQSFTITTWHCFGRDLYHASKYWKWLVRRTGATLGADKRNDEWWSPSRTIPDFHCQL